MAQGSAQGCLTNIVLLSQGYETTKYINIDWEYDARGPQTVVEQNNDFFFSVTISIIHPVDVEKIKFWTITKNMLEYTYKSSCVSNMKSLGRHTAERQHFQTRTPHQKQMKSRFAMVFALVMNHTWSFDFQIDF